MDTYSAVDTTKKLIVSVTIAYVKYVKALCIDLRFSQDTLLSGWLCLVFILSLSVSSKHAFDRQSRGKLNWNEEWKGILKRVYAYVGMYLLLDHYIDSPEIKEGDKKELLKLIKTGSLETSNNSLYDKLLELRKELVSSDEDEKHLAKLIEVVLESYKAQKEDKLSLSKYLSICKSKGGVTVVSGVHLIYKSLSETEGLLGRVSDKDLYNLGYCIQLFDDMIDCSADIKSGINTACTHLVRKRKKLDSMYILLFKTTMLLPECFSLQGFGIRVALYYSADRSKHYTSTFRKSLSLYPYKYIDEDKKFKDIIENSLRDLYTSI